MSERSRTAAVVALGLTLALAATACGGSADGKSSGEAAATTTYQGDHYEPVDPSIQKACDIMMAAYLRDQGITEYDGTRVFADTDDDGAAMADFNCAVYPGDNTASRKKATVSVYFQQNRRADGTYDASLPENEYNLKDAGIATFFSQDVEFLPNNAERTLVLAQDLDQDQAWISQQLCPEGGIPQMYFTYDSNDQDTLTCAG